jgi:hypothetical protein
MLSLRGGKRRGWNVVVHLLTSIHSAAAAAVVGAVVEVVVAAAALGGQWECILNTCVLL